MNGVTRQTTTSDAGTYAIALLPPGANAPLLGSDTSSLGQVIDQTRIESLALNGRMTFRLVQLIPGVSTPSGSSGQFGDISVGTSIDAVPANTGVLNVSTRCGASQLHGTLFEFLRNSIFG